MERARGNDKRTKITLNIIKKEENENKRMER